MNENKSESKKQTWTIIGMIVLIVILFGGIKLIFFMLEKVIQQEEPTVIWYDLYTAKGQVSLYDMRLLEEEERAREDIQAWLEAAREGNEDDAYLLWLKEEDQYVLYLPGQDRAVASEHVTATEELDEDGEMALVLRIRTAEGSEEVDPAQQLLALQTTSENWNGIGVKLILDGRDIQMYKCVSIRGTVYSSEETYMGRK